MRCRGINPDFFLDEDLGDMPHATRLLYIGLWCAADRMGVLEFRPNRLKAQIFPFDSVDFMEIMTPLVQKGMVLLYQFDGKFYARIKNFAKYQRPHHTERASTLPYHNGEDTVTSPGDNGASTVNIRLLSVSCYLLAMRGLCAPCERVFSTKEEEDTGRVKEIDAHSDAISTQFADAPQLELTPPPEIHAEEETEGPEPVLKGKQAKDFEWLWARIPDEMRRMGKKVEAQRAFKKLRIGNDLVQGIEIKIGMQEDDRRRLEAAKEFVPRWCSLAVYLNQRRWEG